MKEKEKTNSKQAPILADVHSLADIPPSSTDFCIYPQFLIQTKRDEAFSHGDYGELDWSGESYTKSLHSSWRLRRWRLRFGFSLGCSSVSCRRRRPGFSSFTFLLHLIQHPTSPFSFLFENTIVLKLNFGEIDLLS